MERILQIEARQLTSFFSLPGTWCEDDQVALSIHTLSWDRERTRQDFQFESCMRYCFTTVKQPPIIINNSTAVPLLLGQQDVGQ